MNPTDHVIGGLAAQVNAAHGRGVGHPIRHPARFNSCRPPSSAGVCDHGMKSVGEAQVYSASLPPSSGAFPLDVYSSPQLAPVDSGAYFGGSVAQFAENTRADCTNVDEIRGSAAIRKMRRDGFTFAEIFTHGMPLHKPSRESMRAVGERFHPAKRAVK